MKNTYIYIVFFLSLIACNNSETTNILKENSFEYTGDFFCLAKVNDSITGWFILDTGSPITVLDSTFVSENKLALIKNGDIEVGGANSSNIILKPTYDNISMKLFNKIIFSPFIIVMNLKKMYPIEDGIIGLNYFENKKIQIDYINEKINTNPTISDSFSKISLIREGNKIYIKLKIQINDNSEIEGLFLVDTGSPKFISINKFTGDFLNINETIDKKITFYRKNGSVTGDTKSKYFKLAKCEFSEYSFENVICSFNQNSSNIDSNRLGSIGNKFLEHFDVIFDISNDCLYLKPNKNYDKEFTYYRSGISIGEKKKEGYEIAGIFKKSSADLSNLQVGDIIKKIDNEPVFDVGFMELKKKLNTKGKYSLEILRNDTLFTKTIEVTDLMELL